MFTNTLNLRRKFASAANFVIMLIIVLSVFARPNLAQAQAVTPTPTVTPGEPKAVLTIVVRDSIGNPLEGLLCEVLSYGWGLQMNEAYGVIAKGETDKNGVVAFDDSRWPNTGYRFKFSPTDHLKPANTYILPDDQNQYRGYPGAVVAGKTETQRFVLSGSDSVFYNDISKVGQLPEYQRDPVAGLAKPRTTLMDGKDFIASVVAATATAEARGEPTPTIPAPPSPSPRPGEIQPALSVTPASALTASAATAGANVGSPKPATTTTPKTSTTNSPSHSPQPATVTVTTTAQTTSVVVAQADLSPAVTATGSVASKTPALASASAPGQTQAQAAPESPGSTSNLLVSILLAVLGIGCVVLFWRFRFRIYAALGIEAGQPKRKVNRVTRPRSGPVQVKPAPAPAPAPLSQEPEQTGSQPGRPDDKGVK